MTCITDMDDDFQAEISGWLFKSLLAAGGAYCGGLITGNTACLDIYYIPPRRLCFVCLSVSRITNNVEEFR